MDASPGGGTGRDDGGACRERVRQCFSIETMVAGYEQVYARIFELEAKRGS